MTRKEKSLLLQDLCARLLYKLYVTVRDLDNKECEPFEVLGIKGEQVWIYNQMLCIDNYDTIEVIRPFLRPMSSITEDEKEEIKPLFSKFTDEFGKRTLIVRQNKMVLYQDWLNAYHFDYRSLIEKGLALEAPKDMYNTKTE